MSRLTRGFIQVYTGNGKGKTTAALGQVLRAAGHGYTSLIIQFMKEYPYNEFKAVKKHLPDVVTIEQYAGDDFVYKRELPPDEELLKAKKGVERAKKALLNNEFDILVLDEILVSVYFKLIKTQEILEIIDLKPENVELILTGRYCPEEVIEKADLVTEMKEVKHYYTKGIQARKGIES